MKRGRVLAELTEIPQVGRQHGVRVAADRILGDAERRAEHARFGRQFIRVDPRFTANTKKPSVPSSLPSDIRVSKFGASVSRCARIGDRHEQPGAALASDARRHDLVQLGRRQPQGFGDAQRGLERQRVSSSGTV